MARFKIEATWDELTGGVPAVQVEYARREPIDDIAFETMLSVGHARPGDDRWAWDVLGEQQITDLPLLSFKAVRAAALGWLAEHHGMTGDDSFEFVIWQRAGRDALERIEAAVSA